MSVKSYITISIILLFGLSLNAQNLDSLIKVNAKYDSILTSEEYGMNRLFYKHENNVLQNNLGPFGSFYYYATTNGLFTNSLLAQDDDLLNEISRLKGIKPFTNVTYINASRKEQIIEIRHIQNLGKLLTLNFDLNKSSSPGAYQNQEVNNTDFQGGLHYLSKNRKYEIELTTLLNRNFYELNGGLSDSEDFDQSIYDDERTYGVNLNSSNSYYKKYKYHLSQRLDLTKGITDSTNSSVFFLKHSMFYQYEKNVFYDNDPTSLLYNSVYLDSARIMDVLSLDSLQTEEDSVNYNYLNNISTSESFDSTYFNNFSNQLSIGYRKVNSELEVFYQKDIRSYFQGFTIDTAIERSIDTSYHNDYIGIKAMHSYKKFDFRLKVMYGLSGYRKSDVLSDFELKKNTKNIELNIEAGYFATEPTLKYVNYTSNHFNWKNNFEKQQVLTFDVKTRLKKYEFEFSASTKNVVNALYLDTLSLPNQNDKSISLSTFSLSKDYKLYNFYFRTAIIYQLTSDKIVAPLPEIIGRQVIYYQTKIFKKALKIQLGLGASYSTNYYGYAFMPALSEFHAQQNQELGYYPTIDLFLNTYLKRAQIFLKYEHFNSGRSVHKAYTSLNYPFLSRSLKFGVSWNMFD